MKTKQERKLSQRVRYTLLAGMAGAFLIPQIGFAAPSGGTVVNGGANISNTASITSTTQNNVITWQDYSIDSSETVQYDANNYLNLVTGGNTSAINGTLSGGGNIYLVNPNGVIFGKGATVHVGSLHVSTQPISTVNQATFMAGGTTPLTIGAADVVNMGSITATSVEVAGRSIRFLNAADVSGSVVMRTDAANDGTAHIGYRGTAPTSGYTVNGAAATAAENYYQLVSTATEFQDINNDRAKNYMLENDINFGGSALTPIAGTGADFTGKFDGNFFKLQNFTITGGTYTAPFGKVSNSRIENVGVTGATITGENTGNQDRWAGGLIGHATGTKIKNVYVTSTQVDGEAGRHGGIVGQTVGTTLDSIYSKATIGEGGGVIGTSSLGTVINDTYSEASKIAGSTGTELVYFIDPSNGTTIRSTYVMGPRLATNEGGLNANIATNTYIVDKSTGLATKFKETPSVTNSKSMTASSTYAGFDINNDGAPGAKWRIYEGRTTPLLTAFMSGTATATYNYRYFQADETPSADAGNTVKSNNGADLMDLQYNSHYVKIVDVNAPHTAGGESNVIYSDPVDRSKIHDYVGATKDFDRANGIRNAGTKAILWTDQDGPNLRGVNVTIKPREVRLDNGTINPERMYNGKSDVTQAFIDKLTSGGISSSGFTTEDVAAGSVHLDFSSGNFSAYMVDSGGVRTKNVGINDVKFSGTISFTGADAGNYTFDNTSLGNITGQATITKAPLYLDILKKVADDKTYNGRSDVVDNAMKQTGGTPNITLDKTKTAPQMSAADQTIPDGAIMRRDDDSVDVVDLTTPYTDPKYTNASGNEQIHVGAHKLEYSGMTLTGADAQNYTLYYTPNNGSKTEVTSGKVYLDGNIIQRQILRDSFKVYDSATNDEASAQKVYDGNDEYTPGAGVYLSADAAASGDTGIVSRDQGHITFALTGGKGYFIKSDGTRTKNVSEAEKLAYEVRGQADSHTDTYGGHLLSDYYVLDTDNTTKKSLSDRFSATGDGKITPKALTATVVNNHITKVYDAMAEQTDGNRVITRGDTLVTLSGFVGSETRTNTSTARYANKDVTVDGSGNPTTKSVTYTASFDAGTGAESENYTLGTEGVKPIAASRAIAGSYTGTITPRPITVKFANATKIYDGTATNTQITASDLDDGLNKAVLNADSLSASNLSTSGITSRFGDNKTAATFAENVNAGSRSVEYTGLSNSLGTNYTLGNTQYGDGTITRRRIDKSGFRVYNADGTVANATKVYDGNDRHTLAPGVYLTGSAASGDTGIVSRDYGKVTFALRSGSTGHFSSDEDGNNRTSHVSEANYVAYDVVARTSDEANNPLSNYTFGSAAEEAANNLRNLETVNDANPSHVTATGSITPASIRATTQTLSKVYDGMAEHTDGNRNIQRGDSIVSLATMITDETDGQPTNTSTARYADKNVAYSGTNVTTKNVTYTAQLTGQYADDYQIVDPGNNVISTVTGSGANKTLTANVGTVADAGRITRRKLDIQMGDVSKTYDGTSENTLSTVTQITDTPASSVIGTILSGDSITASGVNSAWQSLRSGGTASSSYGNGTGSAFRANVNASNGTPHDVRYRNMGTAFNNAAGANAGNYEVDADAYGKGTINRLAIDPNNFDVLDQYGTASNATKVYDGTDAYSVPSGWKLQPSTGHGTGVIAVDADKITFAIDPNRGAHFTKADNTTRTANTYEATRVAYNVRATADNGYEYLLRNYTLNGQNLESGNATATGAGTIRRRTINIGLAETAGIDKVYDGTANLVDTANRHHQVFSDDDGRANVAYAAGTTNENKLVRMKNGYTVDDGAQVTVQGSYADKNVARSGGNVTTKAVTYNVRIAGDAGRNYILSDGSTSVNAESGMNLAATGTISPRDLSGAFKKVTKTYDGTRDVDPAAVGFEMGGSGVISGDTVGLASGHAQTFESPNVRGSGTTWTAPDGTTQHNWVNYSNLSLTGGDAGNYTLGTTARGLGEITPYQLNPSTVNFTIAQAQKEYDGNRTVKWTDGSSAGRDQKNYITSATVNINGNPTDVLTDLNVTSATYDTKDVDGGRSTNRVTYNLSYTGSSGNFSLAPGNTTFAKQGDGIITKKDVTVTVKSPLSKVYDATTAVLGAARNSANATVNNANDIISMEGLVSGDGATNESTAAYADKNAGTGKTVAYDVKLDAANAGNYDLKYNGTTITAPISTNNNTITRRKVDVSFADVSKDYDSTETNTTITPSVSSADAAVLRADNSARVSGTNLTGLTGITSQYGTGSTDATFAADPNAGTNKSVQYAGLGAAMGTAFGTSNYEFDTNGYGRGTINRANINAGDVDFVASNATKTYDGTRTVKRNGSSDPNDVRNYITRARVQLNGNWVDLRNDLRMDMTGTQYSSPNATNGTPDTVTYKFHLDSNNINISGNNDFTRTAQGTIDRRKITVDLAERAGIDKIYDANANLVDTNARHYDKFVDDDALGNVTYASGTTNDTKLVRTSNGAETNDGTAITVTAAYADQNVARDGGGNVTTKNINYNVKIAGSNYQLSDGVTTVNAEDGLNLAASGTITPRRIALGFADVSKPYDTTATNATKNISSVMASNIDGRGAATLAADGITNTSFNMAGVVSQYGAGNTDATFESSPNVVADANGNVIENGKDVQYTNLAGTLAHQTYAGNYEVAGTSYGKGTIRRRIVTADNFDFNIAPATKMYDGTRDVVWREGGRNYTDMDHVKKYFQTSTLDLGGGNTVPINLTDIDLNSAQYNDANVAHASGIAYNVTINTANFEFSGTRNRTINHMGDTITRRDLATLLPQHLVKEYDGQTTFDQNNRAYVNAMANEELTHIVAEDRSKVQLAVVGVYNNKNASAETKAEADARTPLTAQRTVDYTLTLSGDAATLDNYTIGGHPTTNTITGRAADIYKKTLTVDVARKEKDYDATAAVNNLATGDVTFSGLVGAETLSLDAGALGKVQGQYLDSAGNPDPNVSRDANRSVTDKAVEYTGFNNALTDLETRDSTAANYRVESDRKTYTAAQGKGRINPLTINPNHPTNGVITSFDPDGATKVYDQSRAVKHNGLSTSDALKNYLTSATVQVGSRTIDIKNELDINPDATFYDNKNVGTGKEVTYALKYKGDNFEIADFTRNGTGTIIPKDIRVAPLGGLTKTYDASREVYAVGDSSIVTTRNGAQVTRGDSVVELENGGIITGDNVQNTSTAVYADKNAGTGKTVIYTPSISGADAMNYRLVDVRGNAIPSTGLTTINNTIERRRLNLSFAPVSKTYNASSKNYDVTALIDANTERVLAREMTPEHPNLTVFNGKILSLASNNVESNYGYGSTDASFRPDANADEYKDVQYSGVGSALREQLGADASNYVVDDTFYGRGAIDKLAVNKEHFDLRFTPATKEYDGTQTLSNPRAQLDRTESKVTLGNLPLTDDDIVSITGTYRTKNAGTTRVDYETQISNRNYDFGTWDGIVHKDGAAEIKRRKLLVNPVTATKTYDATSQLMGIAKDNEGNLIDSADRLVKISHYGDDGVGIIAGDRVDNRSTGAYVDKNVAWEPNGNTDPNATWQDRHRVKNKGVNYQFLLAGDDALNYEIVNGSGNRLSTDGLDASGSNTVGYTTALETGRIDPREIVLAGDSQTRWINDGLPESYTGTPSGRGYVTELGETLPGEIRYDAPRARLRWGDYPIEGTYVPDSDTETVYQNYRFRSTGTLHIGPYIPDANYYRELTQTSKMVPDEYAYENTSLDRRSHFGRVSDAEVTYEPPSINMMRNGVDITKNDIDVMDDTVYTIVNEVFG